MGRDLRGLAGMAMVLALRRLSDKGQVR